MLESLVSDQFKYKKLTEAEQQKRGILGRLVGPIADLKNPTRNNRRYPEELWEKVFQDPIMKEKIANRCCFGELNHPADRTEVDPEKIAICLAEVPKKGKDGFLYGVFDILATPNGKILKALCDYGCKIGISSRGEGEVVDEMDGSQTVDPDSYDCECFDAVLIPAVESARLNYVTESLDSDKKLKRRLSESIKNAPDNEKKIMKETLDNLHIELNEVKNKKDTDKNKKDTDKNKKEDDQKIKNTKDKQKKDSIDDTEIIKDSEIDEFDLEDEEAEEISNEESEESTEIEDIESEDNGEEVEEDSELLRNNFFTYLENNFTEEQIADVLEILDLEDANIEPNDDELENEKGEDEEAIDFDAGEAEEEIADIDSPEDEKSDVDIIVDDLPVDESADELENEDDEAIDDGAQMLVDSLKEALKGKSDLESKIKSLHEKLAVSDAKVNELMEECNRYKSAVMRLSMIAKTTKELKESNSKLQDSLEAKTNLLAKQKDRISEGLKAKHEQKVSDAKVQELTESLTALRAKHSKAIRDIKSLDASLKEAEQKSKIEITKITEALAKTSREKDGYKKLANSTINKYIEVKADILGLTSKDIKRKLGESFTVEDVDTVCKDLKSYQLNVSKLPFSIDNRKSIKVKVNESINQNPIIGTKKVSKFDDDEVDDNLLRLASYEE